MLNIVKPIRKVLTIGSAGLCSLFLMLYVISYRLDFWTQGITLAPNFHLGLINGGVYFYSDKHPWLDGIMSLSDSNAPKPVITSWQIGDYYGHFHSEPLERRDTNSSAIIATIFNLPGTRFRAVSYFYEKHSIWTFLLSLWYPILFSAVLPLLWIFRRGRLCFHKPALEPKR